MVMAGGNMVPFLGYLSAAVHCFHGYPYAFCHHSKMIWGVMGLVLVLEPVFGVG